MIKIKEDTNLSENYQKAIEYVDGYNFEKAIKILEKELKKNPDDANVLFLTGEVYDNLRKPRNAIECFEKILSMDSKNIKACVRLGNLYHRVGEYKKSIDAYLKILEINPDYKEAESVKFWIKETKGKIYNIPEELMKRMDNQFISKDLREEGVMTFRGGQVPQSEAEVLGAIENQYKEIPSFYRGSLQQFRFIESTKEMNPMQLYMKYGTQMGYMAENNRITGIVIFKCPIRTLPESIDQLSSLKNLWLIATDVWKLPESFWNLKSLELLSLSMGQLTTLPESVIKLSSLQRLDLGNSALSSLPESLGDLSSLKSLSIGNFLRTLPESIGQLSSLEYLSLSHNKELTALPASIGNLTSLKTLYAPYTGIKALPDSIGNLKSLTSLNLNKYKAKNRLKTVPESIGNLSSLELLNLEHSQLRTLPESIGNLTSLKKLLLTENDLITLPESIGKLTSLKELKISLNKLTALPESIGQLSSLEELSVYSNKLTILPESIGNLSSLNKLDLNGSSLTILPESIGNLTSLQELNLGRNNLKSLPESIGNLSSLKELRLYSNKLKSLPKSIGNLSSLQTLTLDYNNLTSLPESIGNLKSLTYLDVRNNNLLTLPESIGDLISLKSLLLKENVIMTLPESIEKLKSLSSENRRVLMKLRKEGASGFFTEGEKIVNINEYILLIQKPRNNEIYVGGKSIGSWNLSYFLDMDEKSKDESKKSEKLPLEIEFLRYCSILQKWAKKEYDTDILHYKLAFILLKRLIKAGDPIAKSVIKDEIKKTVASDNKAAITYLSREGFIDYLDDNEIETFIEELGYPPEKILILEPRISIIAFKMLIEKKYRTQISKTEQEKQFLYLKESIETLSKDNQAEILSSIGKNLSEGNKKLTDNLKNPYEELSFRLYELAAEHSNCPRDVIFNLSTFYSKKEKWEKAIKTAERAIEMYGNLEKARYPYHINTLNLVNNILIYASKMERQDIIDKYLAIALEKNYLEDPHKKYDLLINILYALGQKKTKESIQTMLNLIKEFWTYFKGFHDEESRESRRSPLLWINMTWTYMLADKMDEIFEEIIEDTLIHLSKMRPLIYEYIAWYYLKKGQIDKCISYLKEGKKKNASKYKSKFFKALEDHPDYKNLFE